MKLARFQTDGKVLSGRVEGDSIVEMAGPGLSGCAAAGRSHPLASVKLLAPAVPSKVVCVGLNYLDHAREFGKKVPEDPCLFIKPDTSVIGPDDAIVCPKMSRRVDYEAELGIVIGRTLHDASPAEARRAILGYTCVNDVTARDLQEKDGQWTRSKSFDTFCPIGPWITDEVEPDDLEIELLLNGQRRQHSRTSQFACKTADLVSFISRVMTLKPGDVIATGTPAGIGPMQPGDVVEVRIEGIGTLRNSVTGAK